MIFVNAFLKKKKGTVIDNLSYPVPFFLKGDKYKRTMSTIKYYLILKHMSTVDNFDKIDVMCRMELVLS